MFLSNFVELYWGDRETGENLFLQGPLTLKHWNYVQNKDIHGSIILGTTQSQYPEYDRRNKLSLSSRESKRKEN